MAHVDNLRRYFPAIRESTYLNTGTFGLLPEVTVEAMKEQLTVQLEQGRKPECYFPELLEVQQSVREQLAYMFHAAPDHFALTDSATHGVNIVLSGIEFHPGDEVIVTDTEHPGTLLPIFNQKYRSHIGIRIASATHGRDALCASVESQMNSRTRLLVVSHVSHVTGFRLPIEQLTQIAHRNHVWILIDGAQGAGVESLDLTTLGCDFYALSGQKWLCGPDGTGALYIRKELLPLLELSYTGLNTLKSPDAYSLTGQFVSKYSSLRYEHSSVNRVGWQGLLKSIQFLRNMVGLDYVYSRISGLTAMLIDELLSLNGVEMVTPRDSRGGLVHFRFRTTDVVKLADELQSRQIIVKPIPQTQSIRVSPHFYNTESDILRMINVLKTF